MIVFSASDKGGTGRSVTSCNLAYRLCRKGRNVAYVDFDFGSPTVGALFEIGGVERGVAGMPGMHSYLMGLGMPTQLDVRERTDRRDLRSGPRTGKLTLFPGNEGGAEFSFTQESVVKLCVDLLLGLEHDYDTVIVDLSAGRSAALELALAATARPQLRGCVARWLIFHRWTRQHILAASGLVHGQHGLLDVGVELGHNRDALRDSIRYVRTAVPRLGSVGSSVEQGPQATWVIEQNRELKRLAARRSLGESTLLGETPIEPVLQWREQIILDSDVTDKIANEATVAAFTELARKLEDPAEWEGL